MRDFLLENGVGGKPCTQGSRLLKALGWTPQVPLVKAIQADPVAIEAWRGEVWPKVKAQARKEHRTLVFIDESGFYLLPEVVLTYAPKASRQQFTSRGTTQCFIFLSSQATSLDSS